jgi:hypothetical protein
LQGDPARRCLGWSMAGLFVGEEETTDWERLELEDA